MPVVTVQLIEGAFTPEQKREMIHKLTDTMVAIEGEHMRPVTWVVIDEVEDSQRGVGGTPLTATDLAALAAGKPAGQDGSAQIEGPRARVHGR